MNKNQSLAEKQSNEGVVVTMETAQLTDAMALGGLAFAETGGVRRDTLEQLPCRTVDPEAFFAESPGGVEWAKGLCRECPVREQCLEGALARREPWGVWGGELFVNGAVVARKRPRGRPRKHPLPEPTPAPVAPAPVAPAARTADPARQAVAESAA